MSVMTYEAVRGIFFTEPAADAPLPAPIRGSPSPARRLRDAIEPLACQSIWSPEAAARYVELGFDDFFAAYVWQRTSALGTPPPPLAVCGMGVWSPAVIGPLFEQAVAALPRTEVVRARQEGAGQTVRRLLGDIDADAARVVAALRSGLDAADATARPMFAGLCGDPWPEDTLAQLVHACHLLREHRGDSHLAVCVVAGLDPVEMNILTELYCGYAPLAYTPTRGWTPAQMTDALARLHDRGLVDGDVLSEAGLRFRADLETQTDRLQQSIIEAIGPDLDVHVKQLDAWSNALVAAGGAPPDPAKRAAG